MNKGIVVAEYYFIFLDTNMVPITYFSITNNAMYNCLDKLRLHTICEFGYCSEITITQV